MAKEMKMVEKIEAEIKMVDRDRGRDGDGRWG